MSVAIQVTNLRQTLAAHPQMGPLAPLASKTKVFKQVNADDYSVDYAAACRFGMAIVEGGVAHAGTRLFTVTATSTVADRTIIADLSAATDQTLTLPSVAGFELGARLWIYLRTKSAAGNLIVDGASAETVLGTATQTLSTAGSILRLENDGTAWVAPTSLA